VTFLPNFKFFAGNIICLGKVSLCDTLFFDYAPIIIEDGVSFGYQNMVITSTHKLSNFNEIEARQVIIEANAWITCRVIILGGVNMGTNSVIGSGNVVTRDIPPNVFAAGNPCKPIRNI
jgi:maltose O-acetyltransferase